MITAGLIQARMSSSRMPGKVLAELAGKPMIVFMLDRVRQARSLDVVAVVTSDDPSDDPLAEAVRRHGFPVFRGDLDDVLERYAGAAQAFAADVVVRLTGDCPLIDPAVIDRVVELRAASGADYASNVAPPSFADGLDVECFTRATLDRARVDAIAGPEREHVTVWMRRDDTGVSRANLTGVVDSSHIRLTVDYPDDFAAVAEIVARVSPDGAPFDQFDVLRCLAADPGLRDTNIHARNEGLETSLANAAGQTNSQGV